MLGRFPDYPPIKGSLQSTLVSLHWTDRGWYLVLRHNYYLFVQQYKYCHITFSSQYLQPTSLVGNGLKLSYSYQKNLLRTKIYSFSLRFIASEILFHSNLCPCLAKLLSSSEFPQTVRWTAYKFNKQIYVAYKRS